MVRYIMRDSIGEPTNVSFAVSKLLAHNVPA